MKDNTIRPFIVNNEPLRENGKSVQHVGSRSKGSEDGQKLCDANFVMMTYSQVQTASGFWRHQAVKDWITRNAARETAKTSVAA